MRHDLESNKKIAIAFYRMAKRRTAIPCTDLQECKTPLGSSTVAVDAIAFRTSILAHIRANRYCGRERVLVWLLGRIRSHRRQLVNYTSSLRT